MVFWIILAVIIILLVIGVISSSFLRVTSFEYLNKEIPNAFDGFKIVQISDLHNKRFGKNQENILKLIEKEAPDIIVITGDLIDSRHTNLETVTEFIDGSIKIAPIYYVAGNHESRVDKYKDLKKLLLDRGVNVMEDTDTFIEKEGEKIHLIGLLDPAFRGGKKRFSTAIEKLTQKNEFEILLTHRPELFEMYVANDIGLVFAGHTHGGQIRLPFIGAVIAPNQKLFPKYTKGEYKEKDTTMIISAGIGNSFIPFRMLNNPEIVSVRLKVN